MLDIEYAIVEAGNLQHTCDKLIKEEKIDIKKEDDLNLFEYNIPEIITGKDFETEVKAFEKAIHELAQENYNDLIAKKSHEKSVGFFVLDNEDSFVEENIRKIDRAWCKNYKIKNTKTGIIEKETKYKEDAFNYARNFAKQYKDKYEVHVELKSKYNTSLEAEFDGTNEKPTKIFVLFWLLNKNSNNKSGFSGLNWDH